MEGGIIKTTEGAERNETAEEKRKDEVDEAEQDKDDKWEGLMWAKSEKESLDEVGREKGERRSRKMRRNNVTRGRQDGEREGGVRCYEESTRV